IAFLQHLADEIPASALSESDLQIKAVVSRPIEQLAICRFSRANTCERRTLKAIKDERCDDLPDAGREGAALLRGRNLERTPGDPHRRLYHVIGRGHASDVPVPIAIFRTVGAVISQMTGDDCRFRIGQSAIEVIDQSLKTGAFHRSLLLESSSCSTTIKR